MRRKVRRRNLYNLILYSVDNNHYVKIKKYYYELFNKTSILASARVDNPEFNPQKLTPIGLVDLYTSNIQNKVTTYNEFCESTDSASLIYIDKTISIYEGYRSAINKELYLLNKRSNLESWYTRIGRDELIIRDDLSKKIGESVYLMIDQKKISGFIESQFKVRMQSSANLPNSGNVSILGYFSDNQYKIFKLQRHREVFDQILVSKNNTNRFPSIADKVSNVEPQADFTLESNVQLTDKQKFTAYKIISEPLTLVDSVAGTGKTETLVSSIESVINNAQRILILAHSHRVVDSILERLEIVSPNSNKLRLTTKNTKDKVSKLNLKHLPENTIEKERDRIRTHLQLSIEKSKSIKETEILGELLKIVEIEEFTKFLNQEVNVVFSTIDALLSGSILLTNKLNLRNLIVPDPEFDLVVIEDCSDIDFPTLNYALQFGRRWAIIGDRNQASPIYKTAFHNINYDELELPPKVSRRTTQTHTLEIIESQYYGLQRRSTSSQQLISSKSLDVLSESFSFDLADKFIHFDEWFRCTKKLGEFLQSIFPQLQDLTIKGPPIKNLPLKSPFQYINSHHNKYLEQEITPHNFVNNYEFELLKRWINSIDINKYKPLVFGVFSPYKAQLEHMMKNIIDDNNFISQLDHVDYKKKIKIFFETLHNHKNREYDVMIICGTRSQFKTQLSNPDNVFTLFTRPKQAILMIFDYENYARYLNAPTQSKRINEYKFLIWNNIFNFIRNNPESRVEGI